MAFAGHFRLVDDVVGHFDATVAGLTDPFLQSRYVGFFAVSAVTVCELAIKTAIIEFAQRTHILFGQFCEQSFDRLNGRIRIADIRGQHIKRFGQRYIDRFDRHLAYAERRVFKTQRYSTIAAYESLLTCRHSFAHVGAIPAQSSYAEARRGFEAGKIVVSCVGAAMK